MPPRSVVNEALREGRYEAGMSGGVEAPPHELSAAEYVEVCESLRTEFAVADVEAPDGLSRSEYNAWVRSHPDRGSWERAVREDIRRLSDGGSR